MIAFKFNERSIGRYEDRIEFTFEEVRHSITEQFVITRPLQVIVGSRADHETLRARAPYAYKSQQRYEDGRSVRTETDAGVIPGNVQVVPGIPPPSVEAVKYTMPLPRAEIPLKLLEILAGFNAGVSLRHQIQASRAFLPGVLTTVTYVRHFKYLLWVEEHRTE